VTLSAESLPGAVRISVQDTGEGIPESDLPRVFERFYQVDKSRTGADHGSGLGLAIVREVVAAHGGDVRVQSRPGAGSEFAITLPTTGALPPRPAPAVPGRSVD
jgi:signal transduction histidine kinase